MTFYPKSKRVVDKKITSRAKTRDGTCLYGLVNQGRTYGACQGGLDGHHMNPVGTGGADVLENVITLCRWHHTLAEDRRIEQRELQAIMTLYHGYEYPGVSKWTKKEFE